MIAARQIAFGRAAGKKKPYKARLEYLKTVEFNKLGPKIKLPFLDWTHFEAEISISDAGDRKYIGARYGEEGATGLYRGCYGVFTFNGFYRGSDVHMGFANSTYVPSLDTKVYYKSPSPTNLQWTIGSENISVPFCTRKYSPFYLFHANLNDVGYGYAPSTLWWAKIYDGEELKCSVIPVLDNTNVPCMYDEVSGEFFYNQGDGEFIAGPVVDEVDYTAKDYIQGGLVAMWDGIENIGFGEPHDSSATTWKNLAGGEDIEIYTQNAEWNDSALVGKERSFVDAQTVLGLGSLAMPSTYETVEIVINSYDNSRIWVLFMHGSPMTTSHIAMAMASRGLQFAYINERGGGIHIDELPTEGIRFGAARVGTSPSQEGGECYLNGFPNTKVFSRSNLSPTARFGEGFRSNEINAAPFVGEVCAMRFYSRALSAEEIAYNYNIDKARFNLP